MLHEVIEILFREAQRAAQNSSFFSLLYRSIKSICY